MDTGDSLTAKYIMCPTEILHQVNGNTAILLGLLIANQGVDGSVKISLKDILESTGFMPRRIQRNIKILIEKNLISKRYDGYVILDEIRQKCRHVMVENSNKHIMLEENAEHSKASKMTQGYGRNVKNDANTPKIEAKKEKYVSPRIASVKNDANDKNDASNDKNDALLCSEQEDGGAEHNNTSKMSEKGLEHSPSGNISNSHDSLRSPESGSGLSSNENQGEEKARRADQP